MKKSDFLETVVSRFPFLIPITCEICRKEIIRSWVFKRFWSMGDGNAITQVFSDSFCRKCCPTKDSIWNWRENRMELEGKPMTNADYDKICVFTRKEVGLEPNKDQ